MEPNITVISITDALGGTTATARKLGISSSRVSNWRTVGRFPDSATIQRGLERLCGPLGIELPDELFGWRESA